MAAQDHRPNRLSLIGWALTFLPLGLLGIILAALFLLASLTTLLWVGFPLLVGATTLIRRYANYQRTLLTPFLTTPVPTPYRPLPTALDSRTIAIARDPATWRDLAWLLLNATLGTILLLASLVLLLIWPTTPPFIHTYARLNRLLLAPTTNADLTARITHLAATRTDATRTQASEVRRIERDLHDGAQARLVALGMSLGMAEQMLTTNPAAAQKLLTEARDSTRQALTEIRDLVRGIHPPVLVERGLPGAVHALAIAQQLPIDVDIDLPGRPDDPVESAAYFAIAEILTNTAKHANATRAWVRINYGLGRMVIVAGDNGHGGATPATGTGLTGVQRRLAAFDGTMTLLSPPAGPTIITMELPCALSSPKTSPSSATD
ncbi:sensor histidine kinase [Nocardiopsis ansamitocini]|uniref:histidine kinase n=1 Tax=Nocardiopsis ansamitocini TaxID=1670832 RepID=A0A9W6P683_9ACTN|nr:sensor histidine kinase [Nocardiopsis ansamitocini]GLU48194.1 histidine kinase [Nocardiopsis ansamitocini]